MQHLNKEVEGQLLRCSSRKDGKLKVKLDNDKMRKHLD